MLSPWPIQGYLFGPSVGVRCMDRSGANRTAATSLWHMPLSSARSPAERLRSLTALDMCLNEDAHEDAQTESASSAAGTGTAQS